MTLFSAYNILTKYLRSDLDLLYFVGTIYPSWVKGLFPTGWVSRSCHKHFSVSRSHSWASGSCHKPFWHNTYHAGSETDLSNLSCYYMQVIRSLHPSGSWDWAQLSHSSPDATGLAIFSAATATYLWNFIQINGIILVWNYCGLQNTVLYLTPFFPASHQRGSLGNIWKDCRITADAPLRAKHLTC